jgi:tetratricopeptide (TPR) repeat protein
VQHAHQKGVIHRDLKPSNVLAAFHDNIPAPKVIDFGIAKATGGNLADPELETKEEFVLGTPNYMSPEQGVRGGADVDTRSDIFSLGVLLCELLAGRTPFGPPDNRRVQTVELRRSLAERRAESLSAVVAGFSPDELAAVAERRGSDPKRMMRRLRGDLEAIVTKCLMHDPQDRYGTASGLAADVARHLRDEPVSALPPKRRYQLVKLVRRNKLVFLAGAVVFFALAAGFGTSTWLFFREMEARREQARLRGEADAARTAESHLRTRAEARESSAQAAVQISYGNLEKADRLLSNIPEGLTPSSLEAADAYRIIGDWHRLAGRWPQAAQRFTSLAEALTSVDATDTDNVSRNLLPAAAAVCESGDWERYERVRRIAIERFSGTEHPVVAEQIIKAGLLRPAGEAMMDKLQPVAAVVERRLADPKLNKNRHMSAWSCFSLALLNYRRGDFKLADEWANKSLDYESQNSVRVTSVRIILAMSAYQAGRVEEARGLLAQADEPVRRRLSEPPSRWDAKEKEEFWFDWVNAHTLLDEAKGLIQK